MSIFRTNKAEQAPEVRVEGDEIVIEKKTGDGEEPEIRKKMPPKTWG